MFDRIINKGITIPTDFRPLSPSVTLFRSPLLRSLSPPPLLSLADPLVSTLLS